MEKIFDIAKDSEKSWGVIAQGIDRNFDELSQNVAECKTDISNKQSTKFEMQKRRIPFSKPTFRHHRLLV